MPASGEFSTCFISSIQVNRDERQRRELNDIDSLAESISRLGLLHPIVVTRSFELVAGERRLSACRQLGWTHIPFQFLDELDDSERQAVELEENLKRENLSWQDEVDALRRYHELRVSQDPSWTQDQTAEALGTSQTQVAIKIGVAKEMAKGNERIAAAPKLSTAAGIVKRSAERQKEAELVSFKAPLRSTERAKIIQANFLEWVQTYDGSPFNLIHCDFPYGIGADSFDQGGAKTHGGYEDSAETYERLVDALVQNAGRLAGDSCHLVFWYGAKTYTKTVGLLEREWTVNPVPLIWHRSDNSGILPDPNRGPRQVYETALLCSRGDRKIVGAVSNLCAHPAEKTQHMSVKPKTMLMHFFRMLVDANTRMLDPTAGSGSSVRAAMKSGAGMALGLELNPEWAAQAQTALAMEMAA